MVDFLAELFDQFDQEEQARIRAAEDSIEGILAQGAAAVKDRQLAAGSTVLTAWVLEPQDDARADAAGVVFTAYVNALWRQTDKGGSQWIQEFGAKVDKLVDPFLTRYGREGEGLIANLRWKCQQNVSIVHSALQATTASALSSTTDSTDGPPQNAPDHASRHTEASVIGAQPETERCQSIAAEVPAISARPWAILDFVESRGERRRRYAELNVRGKRIHENWANAKSEENTLNGARAWASLLLKDLVSEVPDVFELKRRITKQAFDKYIKEGSYFWERLPEFASALWEEGRPSLEDHAIVAMADRAAAAGPAPSAAVTKGSGVATVLASESQFNAGRNGVDEYGEGPAGAPQSHALLVSGKADQAVAGFDLPVAIRKQMEYDLAEADRLLQKALDEFWRSVSSSSPLVQNDHTDLIPFFEAYATRILHARANALVQLGADIPYVCQVMECELIPNTIDSILPRLDISESLLHSSDLREKDFDSEPDGCWEQWTRTTWQRFSISRSWARKFDWQWRFRYQLVMRFAVKRLPFVEQLKLHLTSSIVEWKPAALQSKLSEFSEPVKREQARNIMLAIEEYFRRRAPERAVRGPEPTPVAEGGRPGTTGRDSDSGASPAEPPRKTDGAEHEFSDTRKRGKPIARKNDKQEKRRSKTRSAWLDSRRAAKGWTSDLDIVANGGPTYNTIRSYRLGTRSTRAAYVRDKFATVFGCPFAEVPE